MNDVRTILDALGDTDRRLATPGLAPDERDRLIAHRRSLQARFDGLQHRTDYLRQVDAYTASLTAEARVSA